MLLVEHKAPHLYLEDAYKEYSWSVDQGAYQPASFIFLSFDGFRNLCRDYNLQLINESNCTQAQIEKLCRTDLLCPRDAQRDSHAHAVALDLS